MIAAPAFAAVSRPLDVTASTFLFELDQVTFEAGEVAPEASVMLATACTDVPEVIGDVGMVTESVEGPLDEPPPPHPAARTQAVLKMNGFSRITHSYMLRGLQKHLGLHHMALADNWQDKNSDGKPGGGAATGRCVWCRRQRQGARQSQIGWSA